MSEDAPEPAPLVPGSVHRVVVGSRDAHGRGIASIGRRELRVPNALAGETLDVRLLHVGRHVAVGRIAAVVRPADERVEDLCPHGTVCPGCGLRTSARESRLLAKRERLVSAFAAAGLDAGLVQPTVAAPAEDGWRHKAFLTPHHTRRGILLGLFEEGSHRLVPVPGCLAHAAPVEAALDAVRRALDRVDPPIYDERKGTGWLRHVSVRASAATGEALVVLVATDRKYPLEKAMADEIRERAPHVAGLVLNVHAERGNAPFGATFATLAGHGALEEASGPFRLRVSAGSFFQVNPAVASVMQDRVEALAATAPPGPALDLFGGVGATAVRLAAAGRAVTLVEASPSSAADAEENAGRHAPGRVTVVKSRVEEAFPLALSGAPAVVVANPPRSGLPPGVREALAGARPPLLLYVSCDPGSLARDAAAWRDSPLELQSVTPFDLMPQTPHVEALAVWRSRT